MSSLVVIEPSALQALIAEAVRSALSAAPPPPAVDWIDQKASPLGVKRHNAAVRRRVAAKQPGAAIVGRRYLLAPDALKEALTQLKEQPWRARTLRSSRAAGGAKVEPEGV